MKMSIFFLFCIAVFISTTGRISFSILSYYDAFVDGFSGNGQFV